MDDHLKAKKCPKCGSQELGEGKHSGYSAMMPVGSMFGTPIHYIICSNCGFIIEGYVTKPHKFKKR